MKRAYFESAPFFDTEVPNMATIVQNTIINITQKQEEKVFELICDEIIKNSDKYPPNLNLYQISRDEIVELLKLGIAEKIKREVNNG